ncbi:MAG: cytochrome c4 [Saccharospirillum sp.]|nr:cytochrome c4 [Saccharospirillum sp.]
MKRLMLGLAMLAGVAGLTQAAGNAERGEQYTQTCVACHGADGNSAAGNFPKLAGQGERYTLKQLQDIKSGERVVVTMTGLLDNFDDQQLADIAAFYAAQEKTVGEADPELVALGEQLYRGGNPETGVPSCAACHSPTGAGNDLAGYPMLSGQHAEYTALQLNKFRLGYRATENSDNVRVNDGESRVMRTTAFRLKDFEIEALASYISGLH